MFFSKEDNIFLNEIITFLKNKNFFEAVKQEEVGTWLCKNEYHPDFQIITSGVSKYVIFLEDKDYVIKIPKENLKYNYCLLEAENYRKAKTEGFEEYFAETFFLDKVDGIELYVQEKLECDETQIESEFYCYAEKLSSVSEEDYENYSDYYNTISEMVSDFETEERLAAIFGEKTDIQNLIDFCAKNRINDLHEGNFGFKNDVPVILDYSGYLG